MGEEAERNVVKEDEALARELQAAEYEEKRMGDDAPSSSTSARAGPSASDAHLTSAVKEVKKFATDTPGSKGVGLMEGMSWREKLDFLRQVQERMADIE